MVSTNTTAPITRTSRRSPAGRWARTSSPRGRFTSGASPAGARPARAWPAGAWPAGAWPAGAWPAGASPAGGPAAPASAAAGGSEPDGGRSAAGSGRMRQKLALPTMLVREDDGGVLAVGQPAHAWLAGQLARAWGNERFGAVEPWEEVCLAAEQHDTGWASLDLEPSLHPDTGLPRGFMEMELDVHLELWRRGPRSLLSQSRYVALLVSMHGWRLYERRDLSRLPAGEAQMIRRFLDDQRAFQAELIDALRGDPLAAPHVERGRLERNSLLIWTWDYLSLALCLGWSPATARGAPSADGRVDLTLTRGAEPGLHHLDPWPFAVPALSLRCEGRRLTGRFSDQGELRRAFARAGWETLELRLAPG